MPPTTAARASTAPSEVDVHLDPTDWSIHLAEETARGLQERPPWTTPVWFYDDKGSVRRLESE